MVELAVLRGCTASPDSSASVLNVNTDSENRDGDIGWPGMMSIRVYELDGMYDHPILPMAGDTWQLLEIQCHSKLAARRFQKPKKGSKPDGSDDNGDVIPALDMRSRYILLSIRVLALFFFFKEDLVYILESYRLPSYNVIE
jgi:transcription initiation factor TFIID subunit 2